MHVPAAKAFLVGVLAGGHLHQGRAAEKHPGLLADEDVVVAHARLVGAPGGGGAEHQGDGGNAQLGELGDLIEQAPGFGEVVEFPAGGGLRVLPSFAAQVRPGGLHELHIGHPVLPGDLQAAHELFHVEGVEGPGAHGRVMAEDDALHALDDADADDEAGADGVVRAPSGQGADLQKRRVPVQHRGNPLPNGHLAPGRQPRPSLWPAALGGLVEQRLDLP